MHYFKEYLLLQSMLMIWRCDGSLVVNSYYKTAIKSKFVTVHARQAVIRQVTSEIRLYYLEHGVILLMRQQFGSNNSIFFRNVRNQSYSLASQTKSLLTNRENCENSEIRKLDIKGKSASFEQSLF